MARACPCYILLPIKVVIAMSGTQNLASFYQLKEKIFAVLFLGGLSICEWVNDTVLWKTWFAAALAP